MHMLAMFVLFALAIAANVCCPGKGVGGFLGFDRGATWLITLGLLGAALWLAGHAVKARWDGIFIDKDNRISLSRFQIVMWTVLLVGSLFTAGLGNVFDAVGGDALEISIPREVWALLGLGALTAVAAPAIKDAKRGGGQVTSLAESQSSAANLVNTTQKLKSVPTYDGEVLHKENSEDARWIDLILGDYRGSPYVDSSKLQHLAFTLLLLVVYAADLWGLMKKGTPITVFPPVSSGFLALLGISHAAYLADKQLADT